MNNCKIVVLLRLSLLHKNRKFEIITRGKLRFGVLRCDNFYIYLFVVYLKKLSVIHNI